MKSDAQFSLKDEAINADFMFVDPENLSGLALIIVESRGENSFMVAAGSNGILGAEDFNKVMASLCESEFGLM